MHNVPSNPSFANTRYGENAEPSKTWSKFEVDTAAPLGMQSKSISSAPNVSVQQDSNMIVNGTKPEAVVGTGMTGESRAIQNLMTPNNPTIVEREATVLAPSVLNVVPDLLSVQSGRLIRAQACDTIKITPPPSADKYMEWRHNVFTKVASASKRVRECWIW
jgi:hypothetical protein